MSTNIKHKLYDCLQTGERYFSKQPSGHVCIFQEWSKNSSQAKALATIHAANVTRKTKECSFLAFLNVLTHYV